MYTHACIHVLGLSVGRTLQVPLPAAGDWVFFGVQAEHVLAAHEVRPHLVHSLLFLDKCLRESRQNYWNLMLHTRKVYLIVYVGFTGVLRALHIT